MKFRKRQSGVTEALIAILAALFVAAVVLVWSSPEVLTLDWTDKTSTEVGGPARTEVFPSVVRAGETPGWVLNGRTEVGAAPTSTIAETNELDWLVPCAYRLEGRVPAGHNEKGNDLVLVVSPEFNSMELWEKAPGVNQQLFRADLDGALPEEEDSENARVFLRSLANAHAFCDQ